ncbi:High mobility group protein [Schistosoma japonicum]|uniref:High mobility group protein n=1 Tax=Schistosoma japonicum TaxID=6182 RepID=A0A4Z2DCP4_SCHJA|nr:High mobility group protein [Schistosoma japonicum]
MLEIHEPDIPAMRKAPYDKNAPRRPLSAFMLFMKKRRQESEYIASKSFSDRNRIVSAEWAALSAEEKQVYTDQAAEGRESYKKLFAEYKTTDNYKNWLASNQIVNANSSKASCKRSGKLKRQISHPRNSDTNSDCKISIFTHEFLEYNRLREVILRQLKKHASQLEEETALLSKHVENLLLTSEQNLLKQLCKELTIALSDITLPNNTSDTCLKGVERITETSVESFLSRLESLKTTSSHSELSAKVIQSIRSACQKKIIKLLTYETH